MQVQSWSTRILSTTADVHTLRREICTWLPRGNPVWGYERTGSKRHIRYSRPVALMSCGMLIKEGKHSLSRFCTWPPGGGPVWSLERTGCPAAPHAAASPPQFCPPGPCGSAETPCSLQGPAATAAPAQVGPVWMTAAAGPKSMHKVC